MHELSLSEGMLALIEQKAAAEGFTQVQQVWLEVGKLSHVEPQAMAFCFDAVVAGTLAEGAHLELINVPGKGQCKQCDKVSTVQHLYDACPQCGEFGLEIIQGMDVKIKSMAVI